MVMAIDAVGGWAPRMHSSGACGVVLLQLKQSRPFPCRRCVCRCDCRNRTRRWGWRRPLCPGAGPRPRRPRIRSRRPSGTWDYWWPLRCRRWGCRSRPLPSECAGRLSLVRDASKDTLEKNIQSNEIKNFEWKWSNRISKVILWNWYLEWQL